MPYDEVKSIYWQAMLQRKQWQFNYLDDPIKSVMSVPPGCDRQQFLEWVSKVSKFLAMDCYIPVVDNVSLILREYNDEGFFFILKLDSAHKDGLDTEACLTYPAMRSFFNIIDGFPEYSVCRETLNLDITWPTGLSGFTLEEISANGR